MPSPGFQALILCGPGVSFNTFTSNPRGFPKALVPIANRPMVWYPIEWCARMGITDITLITPPESKSAISSALSLDPHFTPLPNPSVLAPAALTQTTGTAEIFRLPEVQSLIQKDFLVLPCDLVCQLNGTSLLQEWMISQAGFGSEDDDDAGPAGELIGRRGGLAVLYPTRGADAVKGEQTDFTALIPLPPPVVPRPPASLRSEMAQLALLIPTDSLKESNEEKGHFAMRLALLRPAGRARLLTTHRDAGVYFLPRWAARYFMLNAFDSLAEDALGWWAKASWQTGLARKLNMDKAVRRPKRRSASNPEDDMEEEEVEPEPNVADYSTTQYAQPGGGRRTFATRVRGQGAVMVEEEMKVPKLLAYVHPDNPEGPVIRRVDNVALLLAISLRLAKLPSVAEAGSKAAAGPYAHAAKIAASATLGKQTRVETESSLVAENVTIGERTNIKESVIGVGCEIGSGVRMQGCLLMDGVVVGDNVTLAGCVVGRRAKVEGGARTDRAKTSLKECEVQEGFLVPWGTEEKNQKYMVFEGYSEDEGSVQGGEGRSIDQMLEDED
ncbi:hypothetical protein EJ06DRAFT_534156 [Trichodelitschia bisporula]|uniref:Mannose-1-phosphate guanyltransferase n=1 Tax=Trichodelitschia bisporula TaxID=703511 RepID=A0A6G1HKQ3_9PEZI|nr:hypothetical protein EJ06DRAFT_534156 [Trichodelitschia bisporula]